MANKKSAYVFIFLCVFFSLLASAQAADRFYPSDLSYEGAMRVPDATVNDATLGAGQLYSGLGWDNSTNSILMLAKKVGADNFLVGGVSPADPVISPTRSVADLNRATLVPGQEYADQTGGYLEPGSMLSDVEYLPAQAGQSAAKYYWDYYLDYAVSPVARPFFGISNADFGNFNPQGMWNLGLSQTRDADKYLLKIDDAWADTNLGGHALGTGRGRTNGSFGAGLVALKPWDSGGDLDHTGYKSHLVKPTLTESSITNTATEIPIISTPRYSGERITNEDVSSLDPSGEVVIGLEYISYTSIEGNVLMGCTRGLHGSTAISHVANTATWQIYPDEKIWKKDLIYYPATNVMESFSYDAAFSDAIWLKSGIKEAFVILANMSYREDSNCGVCAQEGASKWWHSAGDGRSVGYKSKDANSTLTNADISAQDNSIPIADPTMLSPFGRVLIGSEYISYTSISGNNLIGCSRGLHGSAAASHTNGSLVSQIMPDVKDYGGGVDGYDGIIHIPMLLFFDADQIAEIAAGTRETYDIQPYAYMTLDQFFFKSDTRLATYKSNTYQYGITWDGAGNIYIGEWNGDAVGCCSKFPLIHEFSLTTGSGKDTVAPSPSSDVSVDASGNVSWSASASSNVRYVIFKYFPNVYKTVSEFRPIRITFATSWTDPHYQDGDSYMIKVYDQEMNSSDDFLSSDTTSPASPSGLSVH